MNNEEIKKIILLSMYNPKLTLSENTKKINEQGPVGAPGYGTANYTEPFKDEYTPPEYPSWCKYPEKVVKMPELCGELKDDDEDKKKTENYCNYVTPAIMAEEKKKVVTLAGTNYNQLVQEPADTRNSILLHKDSTITFWTQESLLSFLLSYFDRYPNLYTKKSEKKELIDEIFRITPLGTVQNFKSEGVEYHAVYTKRGNEDWKFAGYKNKQNEYYESPECIDNRTEYQKFVDDFGFYLQIGAALVTALAGILCEGCTMPLTLEIITELGLGAMVGWREFQKGENINGAFSFAMGALPILKTFKLFRGVKPEAYEEVSRAFLKHGKSQFKDAEDLLSFYDGLSEDGKLLMNQMLRMDDITKSRLIKLVSNDLEKEVSKKMFKDLKKTLEANPEKIISVPFRKRLYVRELGTNGVFLLGGLVSNIFFDGQLNAQDKQKLDGVYFRCPKELKDELVTNILLNNDKIPEILKTKEFQALIDSSQRKVSTGLTKLYQQSLRDSITTVKGKWVETEDNSLKAEDLEFKKMNNNELTKLRKDGWKPLSEIPLDVELPNDFQRINNTYWYKIILPSKGITNK